MQTHLLNCLITISFILHWKTHRLKVSFASALRSIQVCIIYFVCCTRKNNLEMKQQAWKIVSNIDSCQNETLGNSFLSNKRISKNSSLCWRQLQIYFIMLILAITATIFSTYMYIIEFEKKWNHFVEYYLFICNRSNRLNYINHTYIKE